MKKLKVIFVYLEDFEMFKKRFITLGVSLFALFAVIGAGFSRWYFSNQRRTDVFSNVFVTHANTFGQFTNVSNGSYVLMLDQPTKSGSTITEHNISLRTGTAENNSEQLAGSLNATWTVSLSSYKDTLKNGTEVSVANSYIEYSVLIYIKDATLGQYIEIGDSTGFSNANIHEVAGEHNHKNEGYTAYKLTFTGSNPATDLVYSSDEANLDTTKTGAYVTLPTGDTGDVSVGFLLNLVDVPFQWKENKAPTTFQEYQDMVKTLACTGVSQAADVKGGKIYETTGKDLIIEFAAYNTSPDAPVIDVTQE